MLATLPPFFWPPGAGSEPSDPPPPGHQVVGHDGTTYFVVLADGRVASVKPGSAVSRRFANSSRAQFVASLEALAARRAELERADSNEALVAISSLRHDLNRIDIAALGDRNNWWAVVLDELEELQ